MKKILLDTSFLVKCAEYHIDPFTEINRVCDFRYTLHYVDGVLDELEKLIEKGGRLKDYAKIARLFLSRAKKILTANDAIVDELILEYAAIHSDSIVATHDAELKRECKNMGIALLFIRQKKYIQYLPA